MKYIRELISQSPSNRILAQLFEKLCLIHGHVVSIILPLQQLNEHSNESERILYLHNLNNVHDIFDSTKALLDRNRIRFRHMQLFSLIQTTFVEFYNHLQVHTLQRLYVDYNGPSIHCRFYVIDGQSLRKKNRMWTQVYWCRLIQQELKWTHRRHSLEIHVRKTNTTALSCSIR